MFLFWSPFLFTYRGAVASRRFHGNMLQIDSKSVSFLMSQEGWVRSGLNEVNQNVESFCYIESFMSEWDE